MEIISEDHQSFILRFTKGEEVVKSLVCFARKHNLPGAVFTGLGACREVEIAFYDLNKQEYVKKRLKEDMEIVSLTGNISWFEREPAVHLHGVFSFRNYSTIGGHVVSLFVSGTCEIHLRKTGHKLLRKKDPITGLNLLHS